MISNTTEMQFRLDDLNKEQRRISYQMSTGRNLENGSDDSKAFSREVYIQDKINLYEGIQEQITKTDAQNKSSDSVMTEIKNLLTYTKTEIQKALNDTSDSTAKEAIATNLEGVKKNLFALVNEEMGGEYLFSGSNSTVKPFSMDNDGNVTYNGDGYLRRVATEDNEYRDRGISGFDAIMYSSNTAYKGDKLQFDTSERVIDQDGNEWKLSVTNSPATGDGILTRYDKDGNPTTDTKTVTRLEEATSTSYAKYELTDSLSQDGQVLEAKHNIFEDLDNTILALRGQRSDGAAVADEAEARRLLSEQFENMGEAFDGANVGHAKLGGRNQVFETSLERVNSKITQFNILQQEVAGADLSKVAMEAKALEITFTAMYSTINRMNQLTLVNYIN